MRRALDTPCLTQQATARVSERLDSDGLSPTSCGKNLDSVDEPPMLRNGLPDSEAESPTLCHERERTIGGGGGGEGQ